MSLTMRTYKTEDDYWRIRDFLRAVFLLNGRRELSRQARRFNYWRRHVLENIERLRMEEVVSLWETTDRPIAAVLNPEGIGNLSLIER